MTLSDDDIERLADALAARLQGAGTQQGGLVPLQQFARQRAVSRQTIYDWSSRWGFMIRDGSGQPKEKGDRSASYVFLPEVRRKEQMHQRSVSNVVS